MKQKKIPSSLMAVLLSLTACSQGRESFSTKPGRGYGWKDMTQTQQKIQEQGENLKRASSSDFKEMSAPLIVPEDKPVTVTSSPFTSDTDPSIDVMRSPDHYMKIWFAPYQDSFGNLHESCVVHTILKHGEWVIPTDTLQMN